MNFKKRRKMLSLYIHIPFCKKKCDYCDFVSFVGAQESIETYIEALTNEMIQNKEKADNRKVDTIYIGGGTPSYINEIHIKEILETIKENYVLEEDCEITIEVNPGTVTKEKLEKYIEYGINRLSIGLQSTNNELLNQIGRIHTYEEFLETYKIAREVGIKNINVDLMLALPNQTQDVLKDSVQKVIDLDPEHISVYSLILEEGTPLFEKAENNSMLLPEEEIERKMYWIVKKELEEKGYIHYEISNFAKQGYESKHNLNCWDQKEYLGFGLAAHSYFNKTRYSNIDDLEQYTKKELKPIVHERQDKQASQKEYMMLGLRKISGVSISKFKEKYIDNPLYIYYKELNKLVEEDLIEVDDDQIKLTNKGLDFANLVWEEFV